MARPGDLLVQSLQVETARAMFFAAYGVAETSA
jgi:hypothetical protein